MASSRLRCEVEPDDGMTQYPRRREFRPAGWPLARRRRIVARGTMLMPMRGIDESFAGVASVIRTVARSLIGADGITLVLKDGDRASIALENLERMPGEVAEC